MSEIEQQMVSGLAELRGTTSAQHAEQMRLNNEFQRAMTRLVSVNEEREKYQRQRHEAWQQQLSSVMHFQVTHPTDPGAHPDLRELGTEISRQLTDIRKMLTNHDNWISDYTAEQQGRSEILGLQYKGLFFGLTAAGTLTAVLAATGVI